MQGILKERQKQKNLKLRLAYKNIDIKELKKILKKDSQEFTGLYEVGKSLSSDTDLRKILDLITEKVSEAMKADVCMLRLLERNRLVLRASYGMEDAPDLRKDVRVGDGIDGAVAETGKAIIVKNVSGMRQLKGEINRGSGRLKSALAVPLIELGKVIGVFTIYGRKENFYKSSDKKILYLFASQASMAIENARLFEKTRSNYINTMRFFASIIDAKDSYTAGHSNDVVRHVTKVAEELKLSARQRDILRYASLLHDIGKISIDTSILSKPGPLTDDEWKQVVKHPVVGSKIIKKIGFLDDLIPVVLYHHERWSGGGYPDGNMKGNEIPLESRILSVADAYEAMTSDRPYRRALSKEEAIAELKKNSGTQFDPNIVSIFIKILKKSK